LDTGDDPCHKHLVIFNRSANKRDLFLGSPDKGYIFYQGLSNLIDRAKIFILNENFSAIDAFDKALIILY